MILLKKWGCKAVIVSHQRVYDVFDLRQFPKVFTVDKEDIEKIKGFAGENVAIHVDLSTFQTIREEFFDVVFPKGDIDTLIIQSSLHSGFLYLKNILKNHGVNHEIPRFTAYYFRNQEHQQQYTFLNVNFAYKDYFMVLQFDADFMMDKDNAYRPFAELHEMTHIFLYALGKPVFLFEEGLAAYFSYSFIIDEKYKNWKKSVIHKIINEPEYSLLKLMEGFQQRFIDDVHYRVAASFMDWLIGNFGMDLVLRCYHRVEKKKELSYNLKVFMETFQLSFQEAENFWKKQLKEQNWLFWEGLHENHQHRYFSPRRCRKDNHHRKSVI